LGHVVYKEGIKVDLAKIKFILDLKTPSNHKKIKIFLCHTRYYRKIIGHYSDITYPMDELLRINVTFYWSKEFQESFEILKKKLIKAPILKLSDW